MKRIFFIFFMSALLAAISAVSITQAIAQKQSHKDYADLKITDCADCHKAEGISFNHDTNLLRAHRLLAVRGESHCIQCHNQAFCLDCHTGGGIDAQLSTRNYLRDYMPRSHRNDFLELHPLKAKSSPQSCNRCHDPKYCTSCHARFKNEDRQFQSHRRQFRDRPLSSIGPNHSNFTTAQCQNCHPGGLLLSHKWAGDHAIEARRNLRACQTCHDQGDVCITCHSGRTGLKVNPHPRNWNAVKDNFKSRSGGRSCAKCHDTY